MLFGSTARVLVLAIFTSSYIATGVNDGLKQNNRSRNRREVFKSNPCRWPSTVEFPSDNYEVNRRWAFYYIYHRASPGDREICFRALNINFVFLFPNPSPAWDGNWFVLIDFLECFSISQSQKTISRVDLMNVSGWECLGEMLASIGCWEKFYRCISLVFSGNFFHKSHLGRAKISLQFKTSLLQVKDSFHSVIQFGH